MGGPAAGVVLVTGAAGGIGAGIASALVAAGHQVVGVDIASSPETEVLDITNPAAVDAFVDSMVAQHGHVSALVNNAAVGPLGTVLDTDDATLDEILAVNVKGTFAMARACLPSMIGAGGGSIVNIGSGAGHGKANMAAYAASKAAVHALTMSTARDHSDQQVRVNTVIPGGGGIPTGISLSRSGLDAQAYSARPHTGSVAGRAVTPADVGAVVAFLLSPGATTVSGTEIDVGCMAGQGAS